MPAERCIRSYRRENPAKLRLKRCAHVDVRKYPETFSLQCLNRSGHCLLEGHADSGEVIGHREHLGLCSKVGCRR